MSSLFLLQTCLIPLTAYGSEINNRAPSLNMMGEIGLNTIPSARMSPEGTLRVGLSRTAPYTHAFAGLQMTDRLYMGLRQTSESDTFNSETLHLYPGLDAKYLLRRESHYVPQIAIGLQSALGHKRMSAEYLALSKRYENFDFTFGFGWGRMASRMSLPNPVLTKAFDGSSKRSLDGENPNAPRDWFGGNMGLFGGVEYNTPLNGLAVKADWNSDAWTAERAANPSFKAPSPWSVGLSYRPTDWLDAGVAYAGNQSIMARLTLTPNVSKWSFTDAEKHASIPLLAGRPDEKISDEDDDYDENDTDEFGNKIRTEDRLGLTRILINPKTAEATLSLQNNIPTPYQIGEAARYISNISGRTPEQITFHMRRAGLKGMDVTLNRPDLERAMLRHHGSSEEIWHTTEFKPDTNPNYLSRLLGEMGISPTTLKFKFDILNDVSLSEEDSGLLYRTGLRLELTKHFARHFLSFQSLRVNIGDNLEKLNEYRTLAFTPVRGDVDMFTQHGLLIDREFVSAFATLKNDVHLSSSFGYLEEMYMGLSGELLYRPFGKNWAVGVDAALASKRDPLTFSALAPTGQTTFTAFLNGYYEIPATGATVKASVGRFLGGDAGGQLALSNEFKNGVKLSGIVSASNYYDPDIYDGKTNIYTGIQLSLPLGSIPFVPDGSRFITTATPMGRDTAQRLDNAVPLYDMTEPLSYRHITRHWGDVIPNK